MGNNVINEKYSVLDTLFESEHQAVYAAESSSSTDSKPFIINEFKNANLVYKMMLGFIEDKSIKPANFREAFFVDFNLYVVFEKCSGISLQKFLEATSLRIADKMAIANNLITYLHSLKEMDPCILQALYNVDNVFIQGRRNLCLGGNLAGMNAEMPTSFNQISAKVGELLLFVFANTTQGDIVKDKDNMPPAIYAIVQKSIQGQYKDMSEILKDFQSSLLYSTFINHHSVNNQIVKGIQKAKVKRKVGPKLKAAVLVLLVASVLGFGWTQIKERFFDKRTPMSSKASNVQPAAQIIPSTSKIYQGEETYFVSDTSDADKEDGISTYQWSLKKDGVVIDTSTQQNYTYKFDETGQYSLHLTVKDTRGASSTEHRYPFEVYSKPQIPEDVAAEDAKTKAKNNDQK